MQVSNYFCHNVFEIYMQFYAAFYIIMFYKKTLEKMKKKNIE